LKRTRNLILSLIFLTSCGGLIYSPGYHLLEWKSSYAGTYRKSDTLIMPVWIYGFHEQQFKHRYDKINLPPDSVYHYFDLAMHQMPFTHQSENIRFISLEPDYNPKDWYDDRLLADFVEVHKLPIDSGVVLIPILVYYFAKLSYAYGIMHGGTGFSESLTLWILVFDNGQLVYRQRSVFLNSENLDNPEEYTFQLEQHHWDSVVQMGFKEYIERME